MTDPLGVVDSILDRINIYRRCKKVGKSSMYSILMALAKQSCDLSEAVLLGYIEKCFKDPRSGREICIIKFEDMNLSSVEERLREIY